MKAIASFAVAIAAASALAGGPAKLKPFASTNNLSLSLGVGFPQGDTKDAGVSTMFMGSLDYALGMLGDGSNAQSFVGLAGLWGSGDNSFKSQSYGIHYGVLFGLGDANAAMPVYIKAKGGYYSTRLTTEVAGEATEDTTKAGFGGSASVVWMPNSAKGNNYSIEAGYYFMPSVNGVTNNGWFVGVSFALGGK